MTKLEAYLKSQGLSEEEICLMLAEYLEKEAKTFCDSTAEYKIITTPKRRGM